MARSLGLIIVGLAIAPWTAAQDSTVEKEIALGRALLESSSPVVRDRVVNKYVGELAAQLAAAPIELRVIESSDSTTHALPGGFMVVGVGAIKGANTAAEFAAELAHALAHMTLGHGRRGNIFFTDVCVRTSSAPIRVGMKDRTDQQEEQADLEALGYLDRAGYDPAGLLTAFDQVEASVSEKAGEYAANGRMYITNTSAFEEIRARVGQLVAVR